MSEYARMLAETASRMLAGQTAAARVDAAPLLVSLREAGLDLALLPEDGVGGGCTLAEAAEVVRAWGAHAAPLPIVELLLAPRLAALAGDPDRAEAATIGQARDAVPGETATPIEAPLFPGCRTVLVPGEGGLTVLPADGEAFRDLAGNPWLRIDATKAAGAETLRLADDAADMIRAEAAILTAAALSGAMDHVVATMIDYANTRVQFGRPLGKFQAIQNLVADVSAEATVTRVALDAALVDADAGVLCDIDWLSAKAQAGRAATLVATAAHQLLGAIGFTEEHELHHFTKRLWWWRDDWGRQSACEERVGAIAAKAGADGLWPAIVGE